MQSQFYKRPFATLSQGQQKLLLITAALLKRPSLLILDEPCQGLDLLSRRRVLRLIQCLCQSTDLACVYITHHYEEIMPCVEYVLHLEKDEGVVFCGERKVYDVERVQGERKMVKEEEGRKMIELEEEFW
mmetsp:Transcript_18710/g.27928  ORF Transcript_18710/g.27928 Transcript_18710/m.27928 type:complete len:130 (+) Transcript_18710:1266-1655(+)